MPSSLLGFLVCFMQIWILAFTSVPSSPFSSFSLHLSNFSAETDYCQSCPRLTSQIPAESKIHALNELAHTTQSAHSWHCMHFSTFTGWFQSYKSLNFRPEIGVCSGYADIFAISTATIAKIGGGGGGLWQQLDRTCCLHLQRQQHYKEKMGALGWNFVFIWSFGPRPFLAEKGEKPNSQLLTFLFGITKVYRAEMDFLTTTGTHICIKRAIY